MSSTRVLDRYITCRENCSLTYLESLAMVGFVKNSWVEDCERRNFKRIIVETHNGLRISSECRYVEEVEVSIRIIKVYTALNNRSRAFEKIEISESKAMVD